MQGKHGHLSREQKQLALRLHAKGWRLVDIAREIGCTAPMVGIMARTGRHLDAKPFGWTDRGITECSSGPVSTPPTGASGR
jgi:transposase, IS30 family